MTRLLTPALDADRGKRPALAGMAGNLVLFQVAWFACVLGAAGGRPHFGVVVAAAVVAVHLALAPRPLAELKLILVTGLLGGSWESLLVQMDWVHYRGGGIPGLPPLWIITLWLAFATTLNVSLRWLQSRPGLAALLGFAGGPLAWWGGARLGALELAEPGFTLFVIGLGWAALMPLLMLLAFGVRLGMARHAP